MRIKSKMLYIVAIPLSLTLLLSVALILILTSREMHRNLEESINIQNTILVDHVSGLVTGNARSYLRAVNESVNRQIAVIYNKNHNREEIYSLIYGESFLKDGYIYLVDDTGHIILHPNTDRIGTISVNSSWLTENDVSFKNFFKYQYEGRDKLLYKTYNELLNLYVITTAYIDDFSKFINFTELDLSLAKLHVRDSGYPFIFTKEGVCISHPNRNLINRNISYMEDSSGKQIFQEIMTNKTGWVDYHWEDESGIRAKTMYYEYDSKSGLYICSTGYLDEYSRGIDDLMQIVLITTLIIFIISMFILLRLSNLFLEPILQLSDISKGISRGELEIDTLDSDIDEINTLSNNFNLMKNWIKHSIHSLESKVEERTAELQRTVNHLEETKEQLIQSEKMSSMGNLVAGVAHEINTPLGVCVTTASYLQDKTDEINQKFLTNTMKRSDLTNYLEDVNVESNILMNNMTRAADLVRSFKKLSVDQATEDLRVFDVNRYVDDLLLSLRHKLKTKKINIDIKCSDGLVIESYPGLLSQILTNLILNSYLHGFYKKDQGNIELHIYEKEGMLSITYTDDGVGIPETNIGKIFDPFFTTKRHAGGSGLGLHIVYNIISTTLEGRIECNSAHGSYTQFVMEFPVVIHKTKVGI